MAQLLFHKWPWLVWIFFPFSKLLCHLKTALRCILVILLLYENFNTDLKHLIVTKYLNESVRS